MRVQRWILTVLLVAFVPALVRGADSHSHSHGDHATGGLELDHGKKWPTDSSLRKGMTEIRAAMEAKKGKNKVSMLPAASYAQLGEKVSRSVKFIFKKCKLKPDADAMLHILLAKILNGVEKMKMENDPTEQVEGASAVGAALEEYSDFFNHPGWMSLRKN